jgi:hypothetical protein
VGPCRDTAATSTPLNDLPNYSPFRSCTRSPQWRPIEMDIARNINLRVNPKYLNNTATFTPMVHKRQCIIPPTSVPLANINPRGALILRLFLNTTVLSLLYYYTIGVSTSIRVSFCLFLPLFALPHLSYQSSYETTAQPPSEKDHITIHGEDRRTIGTSLGGGGKISIGGDCSVVFIFLLFFFFPTFLLLFLCSALSIKEELHHLGRVREYGLVGGFYGRSCCSFIMYLSFVL